jgi:hypothetical protein
MDTLVSSCFYITYVDRFYIRVTHGSLERTLGSSIRIDSLCYLQESAKWDTQGLRDAAHAI